MNAPTTQQIKAVAIDHAQAIGGAVHLQAADVALTLDGRFDMTDAEFAAVKAQCADVVAAMRRDALSTMWGGE
jgi:hypothetical protein